MGQSRDLSCLPIPFEDHFEKQRTPWLLPPMIKNARSRCTKDRYEIRDNRSPCNYFRRKFYSRNLFSIARCIRVYPLGSYLSLLWLIASPSFHNSFSLSYISSSKKQAELSKIRKYNQLLLLEILTYSNCNSFPIKSYYIIQFFFLTNVTFVELLN